VGVGPGRQTTALRQLSVLLWCVGLSLEAVSGVLRDLGCPLSISAIRGNVTLIGRGAPGRPAVGRLRLKPVGAGLLSGPDGAMALRLVAASPLARWLEIEIAPGPRAGELHRRWQRGARWLAAAVGADEFPPESA
jgi:hypothetical protein